MRASRRQRRRHGLGLPSTPRNLLRGSGAVARVTLVAIMALVTLMTLVAVMAVMTLVSVVAVMSLVAVEAVERLLRLAPPSRARAGSGSVAEGSP